MRATVRAGVGLLGVVTLACGGPLDTSAPSAGDVAAGPLMAKGGVTELVTGGGQFEHPTLGTVASRSMRCATRTAGQRALPAGSVRSRFTLQGGRHLLRGGSGQPSGLDRRGADPEQRSRSHHRGG